MRLLFLGLNYAPERIGIAVYSRGTCEFLAHQGHEVAAFVGKPYYPEWRIYDPYRGGGPRASTENGVHITRLPHYVPRSPSGSRRLIHHGTFATRALSPVLRAARRIRPHVVFTVAPSLIAAPVALLAARACGARSWLHLQDFEVEAAIATGLISGRGTLASTARAFEHRLLRRFDHLSSISPEMCRKAESMTGGNIPVVEFRNFSDLDTVRPLERPSLYRERWNLRTPHVALYSGNIANKQGIEVVVDAARRLEHRADLSFVICGQGPNRAPLEARARGCANIQFHDLQPEEALPELMGLATLHLLPQKADAADLVLPSKLTNMLASGRPVIATAHPSTGLAREVEGCGLVVEPENPDALAGGIEQLLDDPARYEAAGEAARSRALARWDRRQVLGAFEQSLVRLARGESGAP